MSHYFTWSVLHYAIVPETHLAFKSHKCSLPFHLLLICEIIWKFCVEHYAKLHKKGLHMYGLWRNKITRDLRLSGVSWYHILQQPLRFRRLCTEYSKLLCTDLCRCLESCEGWLYSLQKLPCFLDLSLVARFMGPTWGPSGADRTQMGPMSQILLPAISRRSASISIFFFTNYFACSIQTLTTTFFALSI